MNISAENDYADGNAEIGVAVLYIKIILITETNSDVLRVKLIGYFKYFCMVKLNFTINRI